MKATLKSLNTKYNSYGYEFKKTEGYRGLEIYFEGILVRMQYESHYVQLLLWCLENMPWLEGQTCDLPVADTMTEIDPIRQAIQYTADQDGGFDLESATEETVVERHDLSEKECQKVLDTFTKLCQYKEVTTSETPKMPQEISYFETIRAMNTRVSDDELNAYENELQQVIEDENDAEAKLAEIEELWVKAVEAEEAKQAPKVEPVSEVDLIRINEKMCAQLNDLQDVGVYYDRVFQSRNRVKFIVYKSGHFDKNLGTLAYNTTLRSWEVQAAEDRSLHGYNSPQRAIIHLLPSEMFSHFQ